MSFFSPTANLFSFNFNFSKREKEIKRERKGGKPMEKKVIIESILEKDVELKKVQKGDNRFKDNYLLENWLLDLELEDLLKLERKMSETFTYYGMDEYSKLISQKEKAERKKDFFYNEKPLSEWYEKAMKMFMEKKGYECLCDPVNLGLKIYRKMCVIVNPSKEKFLNNLGFEKIGKSYSTKMNRKENAGLHVYYRGDGNKAVYYTQFGEGYKNEKFYTYGNTDEETIYSFDEYCLGGEMGIVDEEQELNKKILHSLNLEELSERIRRGYILMEKKVKEGFLLGMTHYEEYLEVEFKRYLGPFLYEQCLWLVEKYKTDMQKIKECLESYSYHHRNKVAPTNWQNKRFFSDLNFFCIKNGKAPMKNIIKKINPTLECQNFAKKYPTIELKMTKVLNLEKLENLNFEEYNRKQSEPLKETLKYIKSLPESYIPNKNKRRGIKKSEIREEVNKVNKRKCLIKEITESLRDDLLETVPSCHEFKNTCSFLNKQNKLSYKEALLTRGYDLEKEEKKMVEEECEEVKRKVKSILHGLSQNKIKNSEIISLIREKEQICCNKDKELERYKKESKRDEINSQITKIKNDINKMSRFLNSPKAFVGENLPKIKLNNLIYEAIKNKSEKNEKCKKGFVEVSNSEKDLFKTVKVKEGVVSEKKKEIVGKRNTLPKSKVVQKKKERRLSRRKNNPTKELYKVMHNFPRRFRSVLRGEEDNGVPKGAYKPTKRIKYAIRRANFIINISECIDLAEPNSNVLDFKEETQWANDKQLEEVRIRNEIREKFLKLMPRSKHKHSF